MKPPTHHVEITVLQSELKSAQDRGGFTHYLVWYRNAQGSSSYQNGSLYRSSYLVDRPEKMLDYVLSMTTDFVRENWYLVNVGTFLQATRMTTEEAIAKRLKA